MGWALFGITGLLILSIVWFIIQHKRDLRKDQEIFDKHLENQRKLKFNRRGRGNRYANKKVT
jgi:hypothetical protein